MDRSDFSPVCPLPSQSPGAGFQPVTQLCLEGLCTAGGAQVWRKPGCVPGQPLHGVEEGAWACVRSAPGRRPVGEGTRPWI